MKVKNVKRFVRCDVCKTNRKTSCVAFDVWWHNQGSGIPPLPCEDSETHVRCVCNIAWEKAQECLATRSKSNEQHPNQDQRKQDS